MAKIITVLLLPWGSKCKSILPLQIGIGEIHPAGVELSLAGKLG